MNLAAYTATALSRNDITDTPTNKNIVDGAIVELKDLDGNLVVIYDDAAGTNPETQKSCDTNGQLTFWAEVGDYALKVNSKVSFITIGASVKFTRQSRQAIEASYKAQGYNNVFFFEDGFTYTESNDIGIYEDGTAWAYTDAGALPVTITEGTVPVDGAYSKINLTEILNDLTSGSLWPSALGASLSIGETVPAGVNRIRYQDTVLYQWDEGGNFSSSERVVTGIAFNSDLAHYEVTTSSGNFIFVSGSIYKLRGYNAYPTATREGWLEGFGASLSKIDNADSLSLAIDSLNVINLAGTGYTFNTSTTVSKGFKLKLNGNELINDAANANLSVLLLNNQKDISIVGPGKLSCSGAGKWIAGNTKGLRISDGVEFEKGTLAIQVQGVYGDEAEDVYIDSCKFVNPDGGFTGGGGGFFSVDAGKNIHVTNCYGINGSEWIDINNLCDGVWLTNNTSVNFTENHYDVNSGWNVYVENNIITSRVATTSRAVWISDFTGSSFPAGAEEERKQSNNVIFSGNTMNISNYTYSQIVLFNSGSTFAPPVGFSPEFTITNNKFYCTEVQGRDAFSIGRAEHTLTLGGNKWHNCGSDIRCAGLTSVGRDQYKYTLGGELSAAGLIRLRDISSGDYAVATRGYYGSVSNNDSSGIVKIEDCQDLCVLQPSFSFLETGTYCCISSSGGGTNRYLEPRSLTATTDVDHVRQNGGDTVVFKGSVS